MFAIDDETEDVLERVISNDPALAENTEALRLASLVAFAAFAPSLDVDAIEGGDLRARREENGGVTVDVREGSEWVADIGPLPTHDAALLGEGLVRGMCRRVPRSES